MSIRLSLLGIGFIAIVTISNFLIGHEWQAAKGSMEFAKLVQKRYYFVHRLDKPMHVLVAMYKAMEKKSFLGLAGFKRDKIAIIDTPIASQFKNPIVKKFVEKIEQVQSLDPFHDLWKEFLSYKYIENDLFAREVIIAMIVLYKNLITKVLEQYSKDAKRAVALNSISQTIPISRLLAVLDKTAEFYDGKSCFDPKDIDVIIDSSMMAKKIKRMLEDDESEEDIYDNYYSISNLFDEPSDQTDFVICNNFRFYHIQRLHVAIELLAKIEKKFKRVIVMEELEGNDQFQFEHESIKKCIDKIIAKGNLVPLFDMWHQVKSYKFIDDPELIKEFVVALMMIYKNLHSQLFDTQTREVPSLEQLLNLYSKIDELPITELLNALDVVVEQFMVVMDTYELQNASDWKSWLKKYWWVPPTVLISLILKVLNRDGSFTVSLTEPVK